ncbi:MAG: hypothetical protein IPK07_31595 [Deltaproteobacteria bacterium]|nr:hypothetical protein [Deltaproteobacteria bacterium]
MSNLNELLDRIDAEFEAAEGRIAKFKEEKAAEYHGRQERLEMFAKACEQLQAVWRPRLDALAAKFGKRVTINPVVTPALRTATFKFQSELAKIELKLSASTDAEVRKLVLSSDLEILPILMEFTPHTRVEIPLDAIDPVVVAKWTDDCIVAFVKTYVSLHENERYLRNFMVEDPIAGVRFPKYAAAGTAVVNGKTHYFMSEETQKEFEAKQRRAA